MVLGPKSDPTRWIEVGVEVQVVDVLSPD